VLGKVMLALVLATACWAGPVAHFTVVGPVNPPPGYFLYTLAVSNTGGSEPLSGLIVARGGDIFGLDFFSPIDAPQDIGGNPAADWSFVAPLPFVFNPLSFFSLDPSADMPIDGVQGGFSFLSTTDYNTLLPGDFEVIGIGAITASQIPLGDAVYVPEPSALLLLACGLTAIYFKRIVA
jgi:hypothetical protein